MKSFVKKIIATTFILNIIVCPLLNCYAASSLDIKKSATNLDSNFDTKITLEILKNNEYRKMVDIVFVIDALTINYDVGNNMIDKAYEFISNMKNYSNTSCNYAIVVYGLDSATIMNLTNGSNITSKDFITDKIATASSWINSHKSGSNLQNGLLRAKDILDNSSTGSTKQNRYIIELTDGSHYAYDNANGETSNSVYKLSSTTYLYMGNMDSNGDVGNAGRETKSVAFYNEENDYKKAFTKLYSENDIVKKYADKGYKMSSMDISEINDLESQGLVSVYSSAAEVNNIDIYPYTNNEISTVMAARTLEEIKNEKYGIFTIGYLYEWGFNDDDSFILKLLGIPSRGFVNWTSNVGKLYMENSKTISASKFEEIFSDIGDTIHKNASLYIADEIGFGTYDDGTDYDFEFVNDLKKIDISVNDTKLDKEKINENVYGFGKDSNLSEGYKFILEYYPDGLSGISDNEHYRLTANYEFSTSDKVKLEYHEILTENTRKIDDGSSGLTELNVGNNIIIYDGENTTVINQEETPKISYVIGTNIIENPQTGDNIYAKINMLVLSLFGLAGGFVYLRKNKLVKNN